MKKIKTLVLAAMMLAPATLFADSFERVVTSGAELKTALNALGEGVAGETYTIICDWDAADKQSVGRIKPTMAKGTLIVRSNQTDFAKMPQVALSFQWSADGVRGEAGENLSIIFENMVIDANQDSYFIDHRRAMFADIIALRNCDISNFKRSCLRFDGDKYEAPIDETTGEKITRSQMWINKLEIKECRIHGCGQSTGDNWSVFRTFMPVGELVIEDNMFYDMPYTKSLWETRDKNDNPTVLNFNNNLVLLGQNKTLAYTGFTMLKPAANIAQGSTFYINNNIIAAPEKGQNILKNDTTDYTNDTKLVEVSGAVIMATGNVIDTEHYTSLSALAELLAAQAVPTRIIEADNKVFGDYNVSWEAGQTFQKAESDIYMMEKSNPWYTAGVVNPEYGANNTYVGPSVAYVDEYPSIATVNVNVNGPSYVTYTVSPQKEEYYKGDEVTVSFNDCNSYYRTMTTFKGWNDGNMDKVRTFVLDGDLDVTATFELAIENLVSFFNFAGGINENVYLADIYSEDKYRAEVYMMVADTTMGAVAPYSYVKASTSKTFTKNGTTFPIAQDMQFQSRAAKFGEDVTELQMPVITRRSTAAGHTNGQVNYAMFKLCTKNLADVNFSCYVGGDNFIFAVQNLDYSIDGGQTWTNFASVDLTDAQRELEFLDMLGQVYGWKELAGTLPAVANNKEEVYVRVISDPTSAALVNSLASPDPTVNDSHEYIGQVLVTGTPTDISYPSYVWFPSREYTITPGRVETSVPGITLKFGTEAETARVWNVGQYEGVVGEYEVLAYVQGNSGNPKPYGLNGTPTEGTFYTFTATEDGTLTAYVSLNARKNLYFYCVETATALGAYDGTYSVAERHIGALEPVKVEAGKSYCLYCGGSKLGFYGFEFKKAGDVEESSMDAFSVSDASVFTGSAFSFPVLMTNENGISAFQCDVYLSSGLQMNMNDEGDYDIVLNAGRVTSSHTIASELQPDGAIRVIAYSSSNKLFKDNAGELFSLNLTALEGASENQTVEIRNIRLSTADEQEYLPAPVSAAVTVKSYIPGDANGDGRITIVDVVAVVNALMGTTTGDFIFDAADMDQNGEITIVDVVSVVNVLLGIDVQATGARSILHSDLHVADAEVNAGESTTLYVKLDNAQAYTAMQMDVTLPEGLSIEGVEMVGNASHSVVYNEAGRIAAYSLGNSRFNGGEALMAVTVKADDDFAGTAQVDFTNVRVVSKDITETVLADASANIAGGGANGIAGVVADEDVQVLYYSTTGAVSDKPHKGLNIIKRIYGDGRVEVSKEMNK